MNSNDSKNARLIHLIRQLRSRRQLTVEQAAAEIGVPRSSLARHLSKGTLPEEHHEPVIRWIASQVGVQEAQVASALQNDAGHSAPIAITELLHGEFLRLDDSVPGDIAKRLTTRWSAAQVSILCPAAPPLFLLPAPVRRLMLGLSPHRLTASLVERIRRLHSSIASRIWLYAETLPKTWELILSHRAMSNLIQNPDAPIPDAQRQDLAEIWQYDLHERCGLQIRVLPDSPDAQAVERHFRDASAVVLVDGVFRWSESADHVQVSIVEAVDHPSLLAWDRQIIDIARSLALEGATTSPKSIEQTLGVQLNDQDIKREIDAQRRRRAA